MRNNNFLQQPCGGENIKFKKIIPVIMFLIVLTTITSVSAIQDNSTDNTLLSPDEISLDEKSLDLKDKIINAQNGDEILVSPGTYNIHNITITKNITIQGKGNPNNIIIDGNKKSSIFLINDPTVHVTFKNLTFINGLSYNFGGAICINTGNVYVDNCRFINNSALDNTNAGAISTYGTEEYKAYLFVNNTLFMNNHADHDGGAVTTCYARSDMFNCVFINNTAVRDGGAIRVSVKGFGRVEDCIFMYNHADEWGGAYYSWSGSSVINRCIFMNNTAGTNGGAVMVSGNMDLKNSIIINNTGGKTGGSFYIQEPMYEAKTYINVHDNLITDNNSPKGQEVYIKWKHSENLYPNFNNNDWGSEDPNDYKVNDPDNVTSRIKVSATKDKSNLLNELNFNALNKYYDLIKQHFPENYLEDIKKQADKTNKKENTTKPNNEPSNKTEVNIYSSMRNSTKNSQQNAQNNMPSNIAGYLNPTAPSGEDKQAYELNKTDVSKSQSPKLEYVALCLVILAILVIGYRREKRKDK